MKKKIVFILVAALLATAGLSAQTTDYQAILTKIDQFRSFSMDISMGMTIVTDKPDKDRSIMKGHFFRRDKDNKVLLLLELPEVNKGQGYLRIDDNWWFYDPNTRAFSHTSLKDKVGDSESNNNDFASSTLAKDYKVTEGVEGKLGKFDVYILTLQGTNDQVAYPMMKLWVTKDQSLVLKQEEYSLSKRLMRTSLFTNYQKVSGRFIPMNQLFTDNLNVGNKSQVSFSDVNIGAIPDKIFTKA